MALNLLGRATLTITVQDNSGSLGRISIPVDPAISEADTEALVEAFDLVSDANNISANLTKTWYESIVNPVFTSAVERKGVLIYGNPKRQVLKLEIPSISAGVCKINDAINEDTGTMKAFLDLLLPQLRSTSGEPMTRLNQAYRDYRTTTKTQKAGVRIPDGDSDSSN